MSRWLTEWTHKRILKGLWIDPRDLDMRWTERYHQADAMPNLIQVEFCTVEWITAKKKLPKILGRLR